MIDFQRFWMDGGREYDDLEDDEDFDEEAADAEAPPGVSENQIAAWEKKQGVKLPELLRTALGLRNGGCVRNTSIEVLPLEQMQPVDEDFWEWALFDDDEEEAPDRELVFVFGEETEFGARVIMNFNARGPKGEPSVYFDYHGESTDLQNDTLSGFFKAMLASSETPSVDWSQTEQLEIVARESIKVAGNYKGQPASLDQVLVRDDDLLVLFTRERSSEGECLTRTMLPLPLDSSWAEVKPYRPALIPTFGLHLQPEEIHDIVQQQSEENEDGRWKNTTDRGAPIYVTFESTDRGRLEALRKELLGAHGAARAQAKQERQEQFEQTLDTLSPEQRTAALMRVALAMKDKMERELGAGLGAGLGDTSGMPPELAKAAEAMQKKMQQMVEQAQQKIAAHPVDAETMRQLEGMLDELDDE
ncbi:MAG TPA: SMI1/KNR4 family protein [Pirellulales bacterium]|nr:SMI1/KNR4 family protein [Pirellulales bacterium]